MLTRTLAATVVALLCLVASAQDSQQHAMPEGMPPMGSPAEMQKLLPFAGDWDVEVKTRMAPEAPWETTAATATLSNEMENCLQRMVFKGTIMSMPFHGESVTSYNRETKRYESSWIDNLSAHMSTSGGDYQGDKLVMEGDDIMMGMPYKMRSTMLTKSKDQIEWTMEMSMDGGKTWFTNMEMVYRRKG